MNQTVYLTFIINMKLNILKWIWGFLQNLPNTLKTVIIIILCSICVCYGIDRHLKDFVAKSIEISQQNDVEAEQYTLQMAEPINEALKEIYEHDGQTSNVILLTYHNGKKTISGFEYRYLDYLTEYNINPTRQPVKKIFDQLDWMYYFDELTTIRRCGFVVYNNIEDMKNKYPKLYYDAFRYLEAKAVAIYTIEGSEQPVGLLILLYNNPNTTDIKTFDQKILPYTESLSAILDYNNIKKKLNRQLN